MRCPRQRNRAGHTTMDDREGHGRRSESCARRRAVVVRPPARASRRAPRPVHADEGAERLGTDRRPRAYTGPALRCPPVTRCDRVDREERRVALPEGLTPTAPSMKTSFTRLIVVAALMVAPLSLSAQRGGRGSGSNAGG